MSLRIGSLCTGYGGLDAAVQEVLGGELAWVADNDPGKARILAYHFPQVPNLGDISETDWSAVEPVDVLTAGFPCQDLSCAGARKGIVEGSRSSVWMHVVLAIAALRPRVVVLENVAGLLSGGDWVDESIAHCVCGWTYRRGGLHLHQPDGEGLPFDGCDSGDDDEGPADPGGAENTVWRGAEPAQPGEGEVGRGVRLEGVGERCGECAAADPARPDAEGGTGPAGHPAGGDQGGTPGALRPAGLMDGMLPPALPDDPAPGDGTERDWSGATGTCNATGLPAACPSCGRALGDGAGGPVFRSWMGIVQQDLAQVGFDARWCSVRASDAGAPHRRERVFIIAWPAADAIGRELQRRGIPGVLGGAAAGESRQGDQRQRDGDAARGSGVAAADTAGCGCPAGRRVGDRRPATLGGEALGRADYGCAAEDTDCAACGEWRQPAPGQAPGGRSRADAGGPGRAPAADTERDGQPGRTAGTPGEADEAGEGSRAETEGCRPDTPADAAGDGRHQVGTWPDLNGWPVFAERGAPADAGCHARAEDHQDVNVAGRDPGAAVEWGPYEPAIRRWEALGRPAPRPVEPGRTGERLSPRFAEWMMGLPAGWVTGVPGLSRNQQLAALGDGVVPQQAAMALRLLLGAISEAAA